MVQDAEANSEDDKKRKDMVEVRNQADSLLHSTEKNLKEYGDKLSEEEKGAVESGLSDLKDILSVETSTADEIKEKSDTLMQVAMKLGEAMYKDNQDEAEIDPSQGSETEESNASETIVDAEFEEVDEEKQEEDKKKS